MKQLFPGPLRHAARRLQRAPLFTAITLLTLAVGIGANTALFSVIDAVLLKPLPFDDPDRLVGLWHTAPGLSLKKLEAAPAPYLTYRDEKHAFEDIAIWHQRSVSVTGVAEPEQVDAVVVTDGMFPLLRVSPLLGRVFTREDDTPGSPETVILSYAYWQRKFGGDRGALGRRLIIDGSAREITGVMPPRFRFFDSHPALYLPLRLNRSELFIGEFGYRAIGRLKPGVSVQQANADIARMIPMIPEKFPMPPGMTRRNWTELRLGPDVHSLREDVVGDVGKLLWVLMGTVGIVLLIACANVANLFLVRAEGRHQEFAIRTALGAGSGRLARDLLVESVSLAMAGSVLGLALAYGGIRLLVAMAPANLPRLGEISIDSPVLLFTFAIALLSGMLFGLAPVLRHAKAGWGGTLRDGGRNASEGRQRHRARSVLVVVQVALALVLMISSGLMMRSFQALKNVRPGFEYPEEVLTFRISVPKTQVADPEMVVRTHQRIFEKLVQVPGVISAGLSGSIPMDGTSNNDPAYFEDFPVPEGKLPVLRRFKRLAGGYFKTMGDPIVAGRDLNWEDSYKRRNVVVISENLAKEFWSNPSQAIGRRLRENPKSPWREIVGVAGNQRDDGVNLPAPATVYWPMLMSEFWGQKDDVQRTMAYSIRSARARTIAFSKEVRDSVAAIEPSFPLANVQSLEQVYDHSMARTSFTLRMLGIASAMALLLGIVGIYGVISYAVSQRTREIGIRMALGAEQAHVRRMFVGHALLLTAIGIAVGWAAAAALTRTMSALLFEVSPLDPLTYVAVAVTLAIAALLAGDLPARRATRLDPVRSLQ